MTSNNRNTEKARTWAQTIGNAETMPKRRRGCRIVVFHAWA